AALFWPTLWTLRSRRSICEVMAQCARLLVPPPGAEEPVDPPLAELGSLDEILVPGMPRWTRDPGRGAYALRARPGVGEVRTVLGMVMTNAPWATVRKLSSALAAASAAGAFGIFYSSIWQMAAALSTPRLLLIGLLAMT